MPIQLKSRSLDRLSALRARLQIPRFSPQQMVLILLLALLIAGLTLWRWYTLD